MRRSIRLLHRSRGVSGRANEMILNSQRVDERGGRTRTAAASRAALAVVEAFAAGGEPRDADLLLLLDEIEPARARFVREQIAKAQRIEREMELENLYFGDEE